MSYVEWWRDFELSAVCECVPGSGSRAGLLPGDLIFRPMSGTSPDFGLDTDVL